MKYFAPFCVIISVGGRSPCGERGLKLYFVRRIQTDRHVAPRAGSVD